MAYRNTLENLEARHHAADDRYLAKLDRLEPKAEELIGTLCRDGETVCYINLQPMRSGRTKEGSRGELVDYLIRNKYVR